MQSLFPTDTSYSSSFRDSNFDTLDAIKSTDIWTKIKAKLESLIDAKSFQDWIEPLNVKVIAGSEIVVCLPNMVFYQGILDNYLDQLEYAKSTLGINIPFRFEIEGAADYAEYPAKQEELESSIKSDYPIDKESSSSIQIHESYDSRSAEEICGATTAPPISRALTRQSYLNNEYCFNNFVNGPSTQFAHASCMAVADNPGQTYNPLFLYGSTGLGKTHLLHAVGNNVLRKNPNMVVTYISSERFTNELIYCLRFNKMWDFRKKYRNCDVLLVDDIQFISRKERTQEEFFHTFNALYESKHQIVVTSDVFPQDIPDIEDRLRNRFQWGLIADIQPPDIEHRIAILFNKAEKQGIPLSNEVAQYIAFHVKGSVRVLEGALRRVAAFAALQGGSIDVQLASEVLQSVCEPPKKMTIDLIQKTVADYFKLRVSDLKSKKRQRAFSLPRQIAMYLSRNRTDASFPEIGAKFGGKDHTTIMHAVKKIEACKNSDLDLKTNIEVLERKLDQNS